MSGDEEKIHLEPTTDAERALAELQLEDKVGAEGGIRPEFFAQKVISVQKATQRRIQDALKDEIAGRSAAILTLKPKLKQLREVAGDRFMEPDAVFEALGKVLLTVPDEERARLLVEFEAELKSGGFEAFVEGAKALRTASEGQSQPLIAKLPRQVVTPDDAGEVRVYNINEMHRAMQAAKQAGTVGKPTWLTDYVTTETKTKQWESVLRAWTSTCLKASKRSKYDKYRREGGQLERQREVLGKGREIRADMFLAMVLRYLQSSEELMEEDFISLNDTDAVGALLRVGVRDSDLRLGTSFDDVRSRCGEGGSLSISS